MRKEEIKIVEQVPEDAGGVTDVLYKAWLDTYPSEEYGITVDDIEERFKNSFTEEVLEKRAEAIRNVKDGEKRLTVKDREKIIGIIQVVIKPDKNVLGAIYILPEYQRRGLGCLLWEEARKHLDPGKKTSVEVASYNTKAINFYKKVGFIETEKVWYDEKYKMKSGNIIPTTELLMNADPKNKDINIFRKIFKSFS